ncbi:MAG: hypothetical protein DBX61_06210 [Clostridiales bacterium]|nr:MAG: hypothetical protein DBX61_06210 [Clostridiales bacterium]
MLTAPASRFFNFTPNKCLCQQQNCKLFPLLSGKTDKNIKKHGRFVLFWSVNLFTKTLCGCNIKTNGAVSLPVSFQKGKKIWYTQENRESAL